MGAETYIVLAVILVIVGLAAGYVIKAKKNGKKCIGCPDGCCSSRKKAANSSPCFGSCACCCGCSQESFDEEKKQ